MVFKITEVVDTITSIMCENNEAFEMYLNIEKDKVSINAWIDEIFDKYLTYGFHSKGVSIDEFLKFANYWQPCNQVYYDTDYTIEYEGSQISVRLFQNDTTFKLTMLDTNGNYHVVDVFKIKMGNTNILNLNDVIREITSNTIEFISGVEVIGETLDLNNVSFKLQPTNLNKVIRMIDELKKEVDTPYTIILPNVVDDVEVFKMVECIDFDINPPKDLYKARTINSIDDFALEAWDTIKTDLILTTEGFRLLIHNSNSSKMIESNLFELEELVNI